MVQLSFETQFASAQKSKPDPQTSDMRRKRLMMSALPVASARLSKL